MIKKQHYIAYFFLFFSFFAFSQTNMNLVSAAAMALGGNSTTLSSEQSILGNPALFAKDNYKTMLSVGAQNRFQLSELNLFHAGAFVKKKNSALGIALQYNGVPDFQRYSIGLMYGRRLFSKLDIATRLHFSQLNLNTYGRKGIVDADLGLHSTLNKQFSFGFWVKNLLHSKITTVENTETAIHLGFCYAPSEKVRFCAETEKYLSQSIRFKGGIEYNVAKNFTIRAGAQSSPIMPSFGLGYKAKNVKIDIASSIHPNLGLINGVNVGYSL
jgi:hypothetical protein